MWEIQILGTDVYHIVQWFFIYSILGWVVESIYMSFCNKKWTNRGFIHGPICPIYGVGALTVYFILKPFSHNYIILYFCGTILATTLEYITAIIMQRIFGCIWWDYNDKPFNYKGILCLESSIAWGFYTIFLFAFLHKWANMILGLYSRRTGEVLATILIVYYIVDFIISLIGAIGLNEKLKKLSSIIDEIQQHLHYRNIHLNKEVIREKLDNEQKENEKIQLEDKNLKKLSEQYTKERSHNFFLSRHFIKSYQAFRVWGRKEMEKENCREEEAVKAEMEVEERNS